MESGYFPSIAKTILNSQWEWAFKLAGTSFDTFSGSVTSLPGVYTLAMGGGAFAFIMSMLGAFENAG